MAICVSEALKEIPQKTESESSSISETSRILNTGDLQVGDLIFNVRNFHHQFAGHISICVKPDADPKKVRVVHSTDNPFYYSLCISKLNPHTKPLRTGNHYEVVRCHDAKLMQRVLNVLIYWTQFYLVFDDDAAIRVEEEEESSFEALFSDLSMLNQESINKETRETINQKIDQKINKKLEALYESFRAQEHRNQLAEFHARRRFSPLLAPTHFPRKLQKGFFCSSAILLAFQIALMPDVPRVKESDILALPPEFQIPMLLCTPSMLLNTLLKSGKFSRCGELQNAYTLTAADELKINQEKTLLLYRMFSNSIRLQKQPTCSLRDAETHLVKRELAYGYSDYVKRGVRS